MQLFSSLIAVAALAGFYVYLHLRLAQWVLDDAAFQTRWILIRVEKTLLRHTSVASSLVAAAVLLLLSWLLFKLQGALDLGSIIMWWCCAAFYAVGAFTVLLSGAARACWGAFGNTRPVVALLTTLAFTGWVWFTANESALELNRIFGLPGRDFPAAVAALTFLYGIPSLALVAGVLVIPLEILTILLTNEFFRSVRHKALVFAIVVCFALAIFLVQFLFLPLQSLRTDTVVYFALKYDFDARVVCDLQPPDGAGIRAYKYVDDSRTRILSLLLPIDEPKNLKSRFSAAIAEEAKTADFEVVNYSRYFTDLRVQACANSER